MPEKSGGDVTQGNTGMQDNAVIQAESVIASAGISSVDGMGESALGAGMASEIINQGQIQGNMAVTGAGGNDNTYADTNVNV